jgi:hypothetical protein
VVRDERISKLARYSSVFVVPRSADRSGKITPEATVELIAFRYGANEIYRVISAAGTLPLRFFRICAQRPRSHHRTVRDS